MNEPHAQHNTAERLGKTEPRVRRRRFTIADGLVATAMAAANVALVAEISKEAHTLPGAIIFSVIILGANAVFCIVFGAALRMRLLPLMAVFTTASLTEALLWRSARDSSDNLWIAVVALFGMLFLGAFLYGLQSIRRRH